MVQGSSNSSLLVDSGDGWRGNRRVTRRGHRLGLRVDRVDVAGKCYKYPAGLEFQSVGRARRFMILQVDRTAGGRRRQVDVVLGEQVFVLRYPVTEHVRVVGWNDSYLCEWDGQRNLLVFGIFNLDGNTSRSCTESLQS